MKNNRIKKFMILGIGLILITSSIGAFSVAQGSTVDTVTSATTQEKTNTTNTTTTLPIVKPTVKPTTQPTVKPVIAPATESVKVVMAPVKAFTILIDSKADYKLNFNEQFLLISAENMDGTLNQALEAYKGKTLDQVLTTLKSKTLITEPYQLVIQSDDFMNLLGQYHKRDEYKPIDTTHYYEEEHDAEYEHHDGESDHENDDSHNKIKSYQEHDEIDD